MAKRKGAAAESVEESSLEESPSEDESSSDEVCRNSNNATHG